MPDLESEYRAVSYGSVGMTAVADIASFPPPGFSVITKAHRIGSGAARYSSAQDALFTWGMQRAAGLSVEVLSEGTQDGYRGLTQNNDGQWAMADAADHAKFSADGSSYLTAGTIARVTGRWAPQNMAEEFRVIYVVDEPKRSGFSLGTLTAHPVMGEDYCGIEWRDDDSVWSVVCSIAEVAPSRWRWALRPVLWFRRRLYVASLARALAPARQV